MKLLLEKNSYSKFYIFFFILFCSISQAQLADFSFSVVKTDETCESNATLAFSVQNTTPQSVITYSIFLLPDTANPIAVTTQSTYMGLDSGNYLIIAVQNLNGFSNSQQQSVTILDHVIALEYQLEGQDAICINNGKITVSVTQGQAINYEIISGPILKPLQTSNVFTGLAAGVYVIRAYDNCGNGVVQTFTLFEEDSSINISTVNNITIIDCDNAVISQTITSGEGTIFYPLTIEYTITLPNGQTSVISQVLASGNDDFITINQNIPVAIGESISYTLNIVDGCGTIYNVSETIVIPLSQPNLTQTPNGCDLNSYKVKNALSVVVTSAPDDFPFPLPFNVAGGGGNEFPLVNFPPGSYILETTSLCGDIVMINFTVTVSNIGPPNISVRMGCENGLGSLKISSSVAILSGQLIQAPANSGYTVPLNVSDLLYGTPASIHMNNLVPGNYSFSVVDLCGTTHILNASIQSYQETKTINVIEHCGSFDLFFNHFTTPSVTMSYHLQKFYEAENVWAHPVSIGLGTSLDIANNATQYNIASSGNFRIIGKTFIYGHGGPSINCTFVIEEFDFYTLPKIINVFTLSCQGTVFDVFVEAEGIGDLTYKIIAKSGIPQLINNSTNPLFANLTAAIYTFQIEDNCGNLLVADYEVGGVQDFPIFAENMCPQTNASLSVANFNFLSYQWWKGDNPSAILSTTSTLDLPNFNLITDAGWYHVRVFYSSTTNSCFDVTKDYFIDPNDYQINAGENTLLEYCGNPGIVNLFSLLNGNPDSNGSWEEISNSGLLNGSMWNSSTISNGIYNFKYTVTGLCNATAFATLQIKITTILEDVSITVDPVICLGETIQLSTNYVTNATYSWLGPNGFSSTLQNPIIENATDLNSGTYTLNVQVNTCDVNSNPVNVQIQALPDFAITGSCVKNDSDYELNAQPTDENINADDFTYSWNSPTGFIGTTNPISVLGQKPGIYTVTITDNLGCSINKSYEVKGTVCKIPKGISPNNDGDNDNFDLAGFDVKNIIIYSRYGRIVYEKKNYLNEWHGQDYKGRNLPDATYYYHIETHAGEEFVGWVYKTH